MSELHSLTEVLRVLKPRFPNLNISKVRFLEEHGKIPSRRDVDGNRCYSAEEIAAAMPYQEW